MYEYILKNKKATYAYDIEEGIKNFENTKNIDKILETYNNLEKIDKLYSVVDSQYDEELNKFKNDYKKITLSLVIYLFICLVIKIPYYGSLAGMLIPLSRTLILNLKESKMRKHYNQKLNILENTKNEEKEKLNFLKETDEKVEIKTQQEKIELKQSEEIEFLFNKIYLIDFVKENRKNLKTLYKANLLDETLNETFSKKEIEYIKVLLNNKKENSKVKQLKK